MKKVLLLSVALFFAYASWAQQNGLFMSKAGIAKDFIKPQAIAAGVSASDLDQMKVSSETFSKQSSVNNVYFQQTVNGIPVYNAILNVHITRDNKLLTYGNRFVKVDDAARLASANPLLSPEQAVSAAITSLGITPAGSLQKKSSGTSPTFITVFDKGKIALEDIKVQLVYQPMEGKTDKNVKGKESVIGQSLRLAWQVEIYPVDGKNYWSARMDAATGELLDKNNYVVTCDFGNATNEPCIHGLNEPHQYSAESIYSFLNFRNVNNLVGSNDYKVYAPPVESPNHTTPLPPADGRTLVSNPANPVASPFGWHDTNGAAGAEFTITRGNNVYAYTDVDANNSPDAGSSPDGGVNLVFDFPIDLTQPPSAYRPAAVTNLFYWNNYLHDFAYGYGFDEASGNFQANNYGNGGLGNDYVLAEAQDGSGTNNANFGTPPDGASPRMQMYIWTAATPDLDGDIDNGIIAHEYTHGISNRLTGGPATTSCLSNAEQMGEGWSDFYAYMTTMRPTDDPAIGRGIGTYALGQPTTGVGIRQYKYSTDMSINPFTYNSIKTVAVPHGVGSVWATMLWDLAWKLIGTYGYTDGFNKAMQLVNDGMKLQPCSPGFVDGRNAILAADQALYGGVNQCLIWEVFARRGLGFSAAQGGSNSVTDGTQAFDMPLSCLVDVTTKKISVCKPADAVFNVANGTAISYTMTTSGQPAGTTVSFSANPIPSNSTATMTIGNTAAAAAGTYVITVTATNGANIINQNVTLIIQSAAPAAPALTSPANGATNQISPLLTWAAVSNAETYEVQVATDAGFTNIVASATGLTNTNYQTNALTNLTVHYWRVRGVNSCGNGEYATAFSFTTANIICSITPSANVPIPIPDLSTINSTITIASGGTISDVNVKNIGVTHTFINDLTIDLISPDGTTIRLMNRPCSGDDNILINFDDQAASPTFPCPPTNNGTYQPFAALSAFNGQNSAGIWTLRVTDNVGADVGTLNSWSLDICYSPACTAPPEPTVITPVIYCQGATAVPLTATGTGLLWYADAVGGVGNPTAPTPSTATIGTTSYYVSQSTGTCEGPRAKIDVVVNAVPAVYTLYLPGGNPASCPGYEAWSYARMIGINNTGVAITNYRMLVDLNTQSLISAGKLRSDGGDLRFLQGCTEIPFWIESGLNTASTKIWVKVPTVAAATTEQVQLVYGNPSATFVTPNNASNVFESGLMTLYTFTEGAGTVLNDWVGGFNMNITGTAAWGTGFRPGVSSISGFGGGRVFLNSNGPALGSGSFTVIDFANSVNPNGSTQGLVGNYNNDGTSGWVLKHQGAAGQEMLLTNQNGSWCQGAGGAIAANQWLMLGARRNAGVINTLFVNGISAGNICAGDNRNVNNASGPFEIGRSYNNNYPFNGSASLVAIYNRAMSDGEILELTRGIQPAVAPTVTVGTELQGSTQTICSGGNAVINLNNSETGVDYQLYQDGNPIQLPKPGTGSGLSWTVTGLSSGSYVFTASGTNGSCTNAMSGSVTVTVNPLADVNPISNQSVCNNTSTAAVSFSGSVPGMVFSWINDNTSIGLGANGTGDIPSFVAVNAGATVQVATITVSSSYTSGGQTCTGASKTFTITVNPSPTAVATPASQTICSGSAITAIVLSGAVTGTDYNWTRDNAVTVTGIAASGTGNIIGSLTNSTAAPVLVTFTITPSYTNADVTCTGTPITATVLVNPMPNAVTTPVSQTICSGSPITAIVLSGNVTGTVYNWTRDNLTVTGIAASGAGGISGSLTNGTNAPITVTFTITPSANECDGTPITATVLVNPTPSAVATPSSQTVCTGNVITTIILSGTVTGIVYNWTRDNLTVTGIAASGSGNISGSLTNTTAAPVTVTFTITPSYTNGGVTCTGTAITATVTVNPNQYFACPGNMTETITNLSIPCFKAVNTPNPVFCGTLTKLTWKLTGATTLNSPTSGINYLGLRNMNVGTTTVTYTATFTGGVVKTCSFTVLVIETIPPQIRCPLDKDVTTDPGKCYKTGPVSLGTPTVSDNCGIASVTNNAPAVYQKGVNLVTWTVTDNSGNTSTCVQKVTVYDQEKPTIVCPGNVVLNAGPGPGCSATQVTLPHPVFTDNCEVVTLTWAMTGVTYGSSNTPGINYVPTMDYLVGVSTIIYTAIDAAGNAKTCSFTVTVKDVTPPTLVCPPAQTLCKVPNNTYTIPPMIQSDNCAIVSTTYVITGVTSRSGSGTNASGLFNQGVSTIKWTVKDSHGNTSTCTTTVTVVATSNPICNAAPLVEIKVNPKYTEPEVPGLSITAWPNPTVNYFNLKVNSPVKETVVIRMYDMAGKLVQAKSGAPGDTYIFGEHAASGMYVIEVTQGTKKQMVKLVKLN